MMKRITIILTVLSLALFMTACSNSVKLDKDASLKTDWGTVLQYKIGSDWEEKTSSYTVDSYDSISYSNPNEGQGGIYIYICDTDASTYKYSSSSTYSDWIESQKKFYTDSDTSREFSYSDYSLDQVGEIEADGIEFRLYKQSYTMKNNNGTNNMVSYEAVLKDGEHDLEISSTNENTLKAFMKTLTIKW